MTNEKQKEMIKKILEATVDGAPAKIRKVYFSNKLIIPLFADFFKGTAYEKKVYRQHNRFYRTILG